MDSYKKLKLEFQGIKELIFDYTSHGIIGNYINGLEEALNTDNFENVLYYLNRICEWYTNKITAIHANRYVRNMDEHDRTKKLLEDIYKDLKEYDFSNYKSEEMTKQEEEISPTIFLSHRSSDKKYGDALEKLITGLGVKNNQLIYTSHPLHKIPLDANIYDFLREHINQKIFVIILWSNEYLESPACLNEMGAAWVTQSDYTNFYTPDFAFGNPKYHECAVDTRKMGAVLNGDEHCKASMIEFKNKILQLFNLSIDEQSWTYLLDRFIEDIKI